MIFVKAQLLQTAAEDLSQLLWNPVLILYGYVDLFLTSINCLIHKYEVSDMQ